MADRDSATIRLSGALPRHLLGELTTIITDEGLSIDWDGPDFDRTHIRENEPLLLVTHEVPNGRFDALEAFCVAYGLAFVRWRATCPGAWEAGRLIFDGYGTPRAYTATNDDVPTLTLTQFRALGRLDAIEEHFRRADPVIPPLVFTSAETANA